MGTKKGGARKGKPKGSRLGYDDIPKKKKTKSKQKFFDTDKDEGRWITTKTGLKIWLPSNRWIEIFGRLMR